MAPGPVRHQTNHNRKGINSLADLRAVRKEIDKDFSIDAAR